MEKDEKIAMAMGLIQMILEYGAPAVISAIQSWQIENPTVQDIKALTIIKEPEGYF